MKLNAAQQLEHAIYENQFRKLKSYLQSDLPTARDARAQTWIIILGFICIVRKELPDRFFVQLSSVGLQYFFQLLRRIIADIGALLQVFVPSNHYQRCPGPSIQCGGQ
jgi:hypothetical protein